MLILPRELPAAYRPGAAGRWPRCARVRTEWESTILELAETEARVLLTLDKDFWQIARQRGKLLERAGVLLFRIHLAVPKNLTPLVSTGPRNRAGMKRASGHRGGGKFTTNLATWSQSRRVTGFSLRPAIHPKLHGRRGAIVDADAGGHTHQALKDY